MAPDDDLPPRRRLRRNDPDRRLSREASDLRHFLHSLKAHEYDDAEEALSDFRNELRGEILGSDSYVPVFVLALLIVILTPLTQDNAVVQLPMVILATGTLLLTLRRSHIRRQTMNRLSILGLVAGGLSLVTNLVVHLSSTQPVGLVATTSLLFAFLLGLSIPAMLRRVLLAKRVTFNMLSGALAAYLLLGLFFSAGFRFVSLAHTTQPFFAQNQQPTPSDFEYFSFITITTVGYGDLSPGNDIARAGAVGEAIIGQVFMVTIVARVVSQLGTERPPVARVRDGDPTTSGAEGPGD